MTSPSISSPVEDLPVAPERCGVGRARAKVILLGEHSVVHGMPALAMPIPALRAEATATPTAGDSVIDSELFTGALENAPAALHPIAAVVAETLARCSADAGVRVRVRSAIPPGRGLGSSAAVASAAAVATARLCGVEPDEDTRYALTQHAERIAHGTPSGLDARAVGANGPIWFRAGAAQAAAVGAPLTFVVADSGVGKATRDTVRGVHERRAAHPSRVDGMLRELGALAERGRADLAAGDANALGAGMRHAHGLLAELGVSGDALDRLVHAAHGAGAHGAKLTGGGHGGCVLALADGAEGAAMVQDALRRAGAVQTWILHVKETR